MQQLKIIIAWAHNNPLREAFWGALRAQQVTRRRKKKKRLQDLWRKRSKLKRKTRKEAFVLSLRLHPQSRVLISYCFRPKQRQRSRRSKQMTIKLSNKHHPAMIPNADCGRARRESESGGSRIVSSHFDAELKTLARRKKKIEIKRLPWKKERGRGEEKGEEKRKRGRRKTCLHRLHMCTRLCFISGPADNLYWAWSGIKLMDQRRFEATTGSFPVCAVNAGCGTKIKHFWGILRLESPLAIHWYIFDVVLLLLG